MWLEGRDSNPDTVVQRAVLAFRSASVRSGLLQFSRSPLRFASLRFGALSRNPSLCVSATRTDVAARRAEGPSQPNGSCCHPYVVVQELASQVCAVGPRERVKLRVNLKLCEDVRIAKRLEDRSVQLLPEVDLA